VFGGMCNSGLCQLTVVFVVCGNYTFLKLFLDLSCYKYAPMTEMCVRDLQFSFLANEQYTVFIISDKE